MALSSSERDPFRVALAPDRVLWLSDGLHGFTYAEKKPSLLWQPSSTPRALATNGKDVVVALENGDVMRLGLDGSSPTKVAEGQDRVMSIHAVGADYYWVNFGDSKLMHLPANGSAEELRHDLCFPTDFVAKDGAAFVFSGACRGILSAPLATTGDVSPLYQDFGGDVSPVFGQLAGSSLVWINSAGKGDVRTTALADGATQTLVTPGLNPTSPQAGLVTITSVTGDASVVYYATANESGTDDGHVYAVPTGGGASIPFSSSEVTIRSVASDDRVVAWTAFGPFRGEGKGTVYLRRRE